MASSTEEPSRSSIAVASSASSPRVVKTCPRDDTSCKVWSTPACARSGASAPTPIERAMRSAVLKPTPHTSSASR